MSGTPPRSPKTSPLSPKGAAPAAAGAAPLTPRTEAAAINQIQDFADELREKGLQELATKVEAWKQDSTKIAALVRKKQLIRGGNTDAPSPQEIAGRLDIIIAAGKALLPWSFVKEGLGLGGQAQMPAAVGGGMLPLRRQFSAPASSGAAPMQLPAASNELHRSASAGADAPAQLTELQKTALKRVLSRKRFLVVDDEEFALGMQVNMLKMVLGEAYEAPTPANITVIHEGQAGVDEDAVMAAFRRTSADVVFTDFQMQTTNGERVARSINADCGQRKSTCALFCVTGMERRQRENMKESVFSTTRLPHLSHVDIFAKPMPISKLERLLYDTFQPEVEAEMARPSRSRSPSRSPRAAGAAPAGASAQGQWK